MMVKEKLKPWEEVRSSVLAMTREAKAFEVSPEEKKKIVEELKRFVNPDRVRDELYICALYRGGGYGVPGRLIAVKMPDIVVYPKSVEDVKQTLRIASKYKMPVVPVGQHTIASSSIEGGIILDMTSMNKIVKIDRKHNYVVVEPGVTIAELQEALGPGYMVPKGSYPSTHPVLSSIACFGAQHNFVNRMWDQVVGLEVIMPDGSTLYTGTMLYGDVEHWTEVQLTYADLRKLFSPTYGTMGVITKAAIRIWPTMEKSAFHLFAFKDFSSAYRWTHAVSQSPMVDQAMVWGWVTVGMFTNAVRYHGLDWFEARANCEQDNPPKELLPYPYYAFVQVRGYSEEFDGNFKTVQRLAKEWNGVYLSEEELFKWPTLGALHIYLLTGYAMRTPDEILRSLGEKLPPELKELCMGITIPGLEYPTVSYQFVGGVDEIVELYEGLKEKFRELGWLNWGFYSRMFHYGQTTWLRIFPFIDASSFEDLRRDAGLVQAVLKWALDNYKVSIFRMTFASNDPQNPTEVYERVKPVRRLLRAVQREFDPDNILNPLARKYALS
jgi:FAD/FMN-containing dehydrogenase